jgi:tetratricopeptide (TPR) repeat protein
MSNGTARPAGAPRTLAVATAGITLCALALFAVAAWGYAQYGARLLARLDVSVGEVLMNEGLRLQEAGAIENAKERYAAALLTRFGGEQNRVYTLKLLGTLHWSEGAYARALPYLEEAAKSPHVEASFLEPYCDTLYQLQRYAEAGAAIEQWQKALATRDDRAAMADTKFHEARLALAQGDRASARRAFEEGALLAPGGRNAAELADLAFEDGDYTAALAHVDAALESGTVGSRAQHLRDLRRHIVKLQAAGK